MANQPRIKPKRKILRKIRTSSKLVPKKSNRARKPQKLAAAAPKQPVAVQPKPGSIEFRNLQREWYAIAQADGSFKDIEDLTHDPKLDAYPRFNTYALQNLANRMNPATTHHYRRWSCYLAYNPPKKRVHRLCAEMYAEGKTYRAIAAEAKRLGLVPKSPEPFHRYIVKMQPRVLEWNRRDPRGMDFIADIGLHL